MPDNSKYIQTAVQNNLINVEAIKGYALPAIKESFYRGALANNFKSNEFMF